MARNRGVKSQIMEKDQVEILISKYTSGELSDTDIKKLGRAIKDPVHLDLFNSMIRADLLAGRELKPFDWQSAFTEFEKEIEGSKVLRLVWYKNWKTMLKYAAIFVLVFSVGISVYLDNDQVDRPKNQITLELNDGTQRIINPGELQKITNQQGDVLGLHKDDKLVYQKSKGDQNELMYNKLKVPFGKKFQIELEDGTLVYLNAGSELKYPVHFIAGQTREVFLSGEAYFEVKKDSNNAFVVQARGLDTKVYGTEFNVSSYGDDDNVKVVLVEGSVGVFKEGTGAEDKNAVMLLPNEKAQLNFSDGEFSKERVKVDKYTSWKDGVLVFENEKFKSIIKKLERHYNVEIVNEYDEINENKYTGVFDVESLDQVLKAFSSHRSFSYAKSGGKIIIRS